MRAVIIFVDISIQPQDLTSFSCQGVTALSLWLLTCIMFVFSAVMAYTGILSKNIITFIKIRQDTRHQCTVVLYR